jgi:hypothetical protein
MRLRKNTALKNFCRFPFAIFSSLRRNACIAAALEYQETSELARILIRLSGLFQDMLKTLPSKKKKLSLGRVRGSELPFLLSSVDVQIKL